MTRLYLLVIIIACCLAIPTTAGANSLFHGPFRASHNPANKITGKIEMTQYQSATRCHRYHHKGVTAMVTWLSQHAQGEFWGSYRCEKWGKKSASLHAENRAIDWHPQSLSDARHVINLLLAKDKHGNLTALARRMGVEELIWRCSYWGSWALDFSRYSLCYKHGHFNKHVDPTAGHMNHIHIGFTKAGSAGKTSFWRWYARHG